MYAGSLSAAEAKATAAAAELETARAAVDRVQREHDTATAAANAAACTLAAAEATVRQWDMAMPMLRRVCANGVGSDGLAVAEAQQRDARAAVEVARRTASCAAAAAAAALEVVEEAQRRAACAEAEAKRTAEAVRNATVHAANARAAAAVARADAVAAATVVARWYNVQLELQILLTVAAAHVVDAELPRRRAPFIDAKLRAKAAVWGQHPTLAPYKASAAALTSGSRSEKQALMRGLVCAVQALVDGDAAYACRGRWASDVGLDCPFSVDGGGHADLARIAHPKRGRHASTVDVTVACGDHLTDALVRAYAQCVSRVYRTVSVRCRAAMPAELAGLDPRAYACATDGVHVIILWVAVEVDNGGVPVVCRGQTALLPLWNAATKGAAGTAADVRVAAGATPTTCDTPPLGFVALAAVLAADPTHLGTLPAIDPPAAHVDCAPADGADVRDPSAWTPALPVEVDTEVLGQGSCATVYAAVVVDGYRRAVMKVAHRPRAGNSPLMREAHVYSSLRHDHIPELLGGVWEPSGAAGGSPALSALVLSPVGILLRDALGRVPAAARQCVLFSTVDAVLATLEAAAAAGWSHGDVRASNVLLKRSPGVAIGGDGGGRAGRCSGRRGSRECAGGSECELPVRVAVLVTDGGLASPAPGSTRADALQSVRALLSQFTRSATCLQWAQVDAFNAAGSFGEARRALVPPLPVR